MTSLDYQRVIASEEKLLNSLDYQIHPPVEEIYIDYVISELIVNSKLKGFILKYLKVALFFNFLRKYNVRLAVLATIRHAINLHFSNLKSSFVALLKTLAIEEDAFTATSKNFFADFENMSEFSKCKGLEVVVN